MWEKIQAMMSADRLMPIASAGLRVLIILLAAAVGTKVLKRWAPRVVAYLAQRMGNRDGEERGELDKRAATLGGIIITTVSVIIWGLALIMTLKEVGFNVAPLLAGAGVVGLAIGFGAQNIVRDVFTGALMLLENQVRVGDVAIVNGTGGLVERINLRTIVLRSLDGTVHVFSNGAVTNLSNMTHEFSFYVFDVGVAYKEDTDRVVAVLEEVGKDLMADETYRSEILAPLEVLGVDKFADSAVIIKARIKTRPIKQWFVGREFNRRMKKRFDQEGIEIPFPHLSLYAGEASKPLPLGLPAQHSQGELRALVEEVVAQRAGGMGKDAETPASTGPRA